MQHSTKNCNQNNEILKKFDYCKIYIFLHIINPFINY